jgi:predicted esterase
MKRRPPSHCEFPPPPRRLLGRCALGVVIAALVLVRATAPAIGQTLRLVDGRILTGRVWFTSGVVDVIDAAADAESTQGPSRPIMMVDDELRRLFISKRLVAEVLEQAPEPLVTIRPWQKTAQGALKLVSVGPALNLTAFDKYGRRIYEMQSPDGVISVIQGITELTPRYAKLESLQGPERVVAWSSSIATSGIPRDSLAAILRHAIVQNDPQSRLQAVRFYIQGRRYQEAREELDRIIEEFPEMQDLKSEAALLRQSSARALLEELRMRRAAGQHRLVAALLDNFPVEEVSGEMLVEVRELVGQYEREDLRIAAIRDRLRQSVAAIADPDNRGLAAPLAEEVARELSPNTADRLAPFVQLLDDPGMSAEEKTALAVTGWLLGGDHADRDLVAAVALVKVRDAVLRYLEERDAAVRREALDSILTLDGVTVDRIARLVAHMKPPRHQADFAKSPTGYFELTAPGQTEDGDFPYAVQLPPEYDPYRRYPTIVALNGAYNSPENELDYWAGAAPAPSADGKATARRGQAMRHGYIVVAPMWQKPHQFQYENSGREHVAVLTVLRDAMRRLSIDADRVYLAGHDIGGDATWDLAQAHPDLWAGAMPFVAEVGEKYARHYWENAAYVPLYFVAGELDGRSVAANAPVWNKYLRTPGIDATVAEYKGRGHEPFHDEVLALFDWMGRKTRQFPPKEFDCKTLRPWDNFFWWVECRDFNERNMVHPTDWVSRGLRPARVEGRVQNENRLAAESSAGEATLWLSPEIVDFAKPIRVTYNGRKVSGEAELRPDAETLLEDVRTRGDRQRPFWAKLEVR